MGAEDKCVCFKESVTLCAVCLHALVYVYKAVSVCFNVCFEVMCICVIVFAFLNVCEPVCVLCV